MQLESPITNPQCLIFSYETFLGFVDIHDGFFRQFASFRSLMTSKEPFWGGLGKTYFLERK